MNKEKKTRERCRDCIYFHRIPRLDDRGKFSRNCVCRLSPEMLIDIYTRRPDWCKRDVLQADKALSNMTEIKNTEFVMDILEEDSHGEIKSDS